MKYELPEPRYHTTTDCDSKLKYIQHYTADQMHAAYAAGAASRDAEVDALRNRVADLTNRLHDEKQSVRNLEANIEALRKDKRLLVDACGHYEAALHEAFPSGATGHVFMHWNDSRKLLNERAAIAAEGLKK